MQFTKFKWLVQFTRVVSQIHYTPEYIAMLFTYVAIITLTNSWNIASAIALILSILLVSLGDTIFDRFEQNTRDLMISKYIYTGRGLSSRRVKLLTRILKNFVLGIVLFLGYILSYPVTYGVVPPLLLLVAFGVLSVSALVIYFFPKISIVFWISQRKTDVEVELPYALVFLRTLAPLRLPVYELIELIEESVSLKAFAKEVKLAKKISSATSTSFLTALDTLTANHPSEKMREIFRRIILVAASMGDIKEIAEKVFEEVYTWFESRISALVEKFTIIVGTALFAYFFTPIVVAAIAPIIGASTLPILVFILSIQLLAFFVLYTLITSFYPTSLVIKPSRVSLMVGGIFIVSSLMLAIANIFLNILGLGINDKILIVMFAVFLGIPILFTEKEIRRAKFYDRFVQMSSDTLSLVAITGENPAKTLLENSKSYGDKMRRFVTVIVSGYTSPALRQALIAKAPSLYHATFIETLVTVLRLGFKPEALRTFATSYEKLNIVVGSARGFASMLETVMIGLSVVAGGFLAYLDKIYNNLWSLIMKVGVVGSTTVIFAQMPSIYAIIDALTVLSMLLTSMFVGKVRGGSILYSFRAALAMVVFYAVAKYIVLNLAF
ncbi:MAG: hypothetical protein QW775_03055 [Ignisphaera sp.]|uniref:Type II secretion system protein GspF domain-containing protein n=1 Tax=Ignisphaera aggregans TaxID=334771 RepID=A0A832FPW9_9CREN